MASSPPSWLALDKTLRVSADQGDGFSIHRAKPPLLSHLIISAQPQAAASPLVDVLAADLCAQPQAAARPRVDVLAADLSAGLFLLPATPPANTGYTVLDAASPNNTYRVPGHTVSGVDLGVISGGSGGFMVVGFQHQPGNPKAWLHCYSQSLACWVTKEVDNPLAARAWTFVDVIAHDGRLWWVHTASTDGASGLLSCDPFDDKPEIVFSAGYDVRCPRCFHVPLAARRCVQVAEGKLRWVQTTCEHTDALGAPSVFMLTLDDDATATAEWTMSFADLWADDSYKSTELPKVEPALAFIHPKVSSVVYFSLGKCLLGVDMRAREMVAYSTDSDVSSLLAWVLPTAAAPQKTMMSSSSDDEVKLCLIASHDYGENDPSVFILRNHLQQAAKVDFGILEAILTEFDKAATADSKKHDHLCLKFLRNDKIIEYVDFEPMTGDNEISFNLDLTIDVANNTLILTAYDKQGSSALWNSTNIYSMEFGDNILRYRGYVSVMNFFPLRVEFGRHFANMDVEQLCAKSQKDDYCSTEFCALQEAQDAPEKEKDGV